MIREIFIGYEPREAEAFAVARASIRKHGGSKILIRGIVLKDLQRGGLYTRPTRHHLGRLKDELSSTDEYDGSMSTEFAIARFFVPYVATRSEWALFVDCDIMVRDNLVELFDLCKLHGDKALLCVHHDYLPAEYSKMDNQLQTSYFRKNWSSVMAWNLGHPAHERLTLDMLNTIPGRDLHRFAWLKDDEIGELPYSWNWLAQVSEPIPNPKLVHWTLGGPWLPAFHDAPFAEEWRELRDGWARSESQKGLWEQRPIQPAWLQGAATGRA